MPRVVKKTELDRKLNTGEQLLVTGPKGDLGASMPNELKWTMDPHARVPDEMRTYGEGVNKELDRAKEVQNRIYASPQEMTSVSDDETPAETEVENAA